MADAGSISIALPTVPDAARGDSSSPVPGFWRRALRLGGLGVVAAFVGAAWLTAPAPFEPYVSPRTLAILAQAPAADRLVIGDSRLDGMRSGGGVVFAGYSGSTIGDMTRMARVLCLLSDGEIVIALGTNDAKPDVRRPAASLETLERMIAGCGPARVWVAEVWPAEPDKGPVGQHFDPATIAALNRGIRQLTAQGMGRLIPQPVLANHTYDGVHFNPATARRYQQVLREYGAS